MKKSTIQLPRRDFMKLLAGNALTARLGPWGTSLDTPLWSPNMPAIEPKQQGSSQFVIDFSPQSGNLYSLKIVNDAFDTDYLFGDGIGAVDVIYRLGQGDLARAQTKNSDDVRTTRTLPNGEGFEVTYSGESQHRHGIQAFELVETFRNLGTSVDWTMEFRNTQDQPLELADVGVRLLFSTNYEQDGVTTQTQRVVRHSFISGAGSYIVLTRPNGVPPYVVLTPLPGTSLEYFTRDDGGGAWEGVYTAFIHAAYSNRPDQVGSWRQPATSVTLQPAGQASDRVTYGFRFRKADSYDSVRTILYEEELVDVQVAPGMTLPVDLTTTIALRTQHPELSLSAEYPDQTQIEAIGESQGYQLYRLAFSHPGENCITVQFAPERELYLEFFVTEPIETLIKKRAAFITAHQQVRAPEKWYDGLFSLWDMQEKILRTPDDQGGLAYRYMVGGSDDPCLCKAPYVATKNLHFPDPNEIEALEYYLEHFVWGKLQRTDTEEPFPYGVYGVDNWYVNRNSDIGFNSGGNGQEHLWRTYDYPHLFLLYFNMYQIAKFYPEFVHYLDARGYLERAFGTAYAFFVVPFNIHMGEPFFIKGWSDWAYKLGNYHELVIPDLIDVLYAEGMTTEADALRGEWEKKVKYFVYDDPYPFGSEMFFDSTGFESTHAIAKYGLEHEVLPDVNLWQDKNTAEWYSHPEIHPEDFQQFMENEIQANLAARGVLETSYYQLGSDLRMSGNTDYLLSYMTQMGGWSIVDYALYFASEPEKYMRLGYASYLASWALINSGSPETNYGFWFPGPENDGAAGWAFKPERFGPTWMGRGNSLAQGRGLWRYDGEIDGGFSGGLRISATIVVNDPIFGLFCYGGIVNSDGETYAVTPRDGLRQRLHLLVYQPGVHLSLNRDAFASSAPIMISKTLDYMQFRLENRYSSAHETHLTITGLSGAKHQARVDDKVIMGEMQGDNVVFHLPVADAPEYDVRIERT